MALKIRKDGAWVTVADVGIKGEKGLKGEKGVKGEKGEKGTKGQKGLKGTDGAVAEKGQKGLKGEKGVKGEKGTKGFKGEPSDIKGEKGEKGTKGQKGLKGTDGAVAEKGQKGLKGEKGVKGEKGTKGFKGEPSDIKGEKGEKGTKGQKGLKGTDGAVAEKGQKGLKGEKGVKGEKGSVEAQGNKGEKGHKGVKGQKGVTEFKGQKGQKGAVEAQGNKGQKGVQGDKGQKGEKGAVEAQGNKGQKGQKGALNDNKGSKGQKGDVEEQGNKGQKGEGDKGEKGVTEFKGEKGQKGREGDVTTKGAKGEPSDVKGQKGEKGDVTAKGVKGNEGDKGQKGVTEFKGEKGQKGREGDVTTKGAKGEPGNKGQKGGDGGGTTYTLPTFGTSNASSGIRLSGGGIDDDVNITGDGGITVVGNASNNTLTIDGSNAGGAADKIFELNTSVECIDSGTNGVVEITIDGNHIADFNNDYQLLLKDHPTDPKEGGQLQFENPLGQIDYAIDVYADNETQAGSVIRVIDEVTRTGGTGTQRFCVNRDGAFGVGHVGSENYGTPGQVLTSAGDEDPPTWGAAGGGGAPSIRVASGILGSDFSTFSNGVYAQVGTIAAQITKDAGRNMLVQATMPFTHGVTDEGDDSGYTEVYFLLRRRIGTSGGWTNIGQELALQHLTARGTSNDSRYNNFASLQVHDAGLTATAYPTLQYSIWAKYISIGDSVNNPLDLLKGTSIVAMEC